MKTRLAVIGSGFGLYGLLPAFQQIAACEVVGLCGKSTPRLVDYCQKTSVPVFHDWRKMIDTTKPDAIAVAVVPKHQYEILQYALGRGISAFAEKPLCIDVAQAKELLQLAQSKKAANMVDFIFPEIPEWKKARELLHAGAIGEVKNISMDWHFLSHDIKNKIDGWKTKPEEGGGALSFFFCHVFHNLEFFLGPIDSFTSKLTYSSISINPGETGVHLEIKFQNGCTGEIHFDCASCEPARHVLQFDGSAGKLVLENSTATFTRFRLLKSDEPVAVEKPPLNPALDERVGIVQPLAERFIHWCQSGQSAKPDFTDGLRVQELIQQARG